MTDFSQDSLVAAAGIDPWKLRDQFTAGDPEEIYAMARAFNQAAAQQGDAVTLTTKGLETAGDGYKVNNATPIDVTAQVAQARRELGNSGEKLGRIAKLLSASASDLAQRTATAKTQVTALEGDVNGIIGEWNALVRVAHNDPDFQQQHASYQAPYVQRAVQKVKDYGGPLRRSVEDYEKSLADQLKAMADLGYIPPSDLDEGPGDVDIPDPKTAAAGTVAATRNADPTRARAEFAANTAYLNLLNEKQRAGLPLTGAEKQWLKGYYQELSPHFGEVKNWADKQVGVNPGQKPDQHNPVVQLVSRVGDGFLNLSRNVPYDELPQSARDILALNLGSTDPQDQAGFYATPGERHIGDDWPPSTDPNLLAAAGFVGLLNDYSSDDVAPGNDLSTHLKDAALRWKHQINIMYTNYKADYPIAHAYGYRGPELSADDWNKLMPDELSSDALGVVARNRPFSNDWIVHNAAERRAVMGMNWQSGQGAADVLLSASMRGHGLPDDKAAAAGLAIVQDASTDYNGLAHLANRRVKGAIADVGLVYVDSFAQYDTGRDGVTTLTLPDGTKVSGFTLDPATRSNFLKFVAASDPAVYQHFREGTLERGSEYLRAVLAQGHTDPHDRVYQQALRDAIRLTSGADAAAAGVLVDAAKEGAGDNEVQKLKEDLAYAQAMSDYNSKKGIVDTVKNVFSVAGLATLPTGAGTVLNVSSTGFGLITDAVLQPPTPADQAHYITDLDGYVRHLADGHVADDAAKLQAQDNIITMTVNARAATGDPVVDGAGRPVVPDADGQYDEPTVGDLYGRLDPWTLDLGARTVNEVISTQNVASGHGGGYSTQFGTDVAGTAPDRVGALGDAGGNWSHTDDRYRIYYGDETRYQYHAPTTWEGAYLDRQVPDDKADTGTAAPDVPAAT
jgi:hypothetical protein